MTTSVLPRIHSNGEVSKDIVSGRVSSSRVKETIAALAQGESWSELWQIADSMSREVSVLFDADGRIWVDIGTTGHVSLEPPLGATIPFRLWVHTHPWDPYWSQTDKDTLAAYSMILESALVLGHDRMKWSRNGSDMQTIEPSGPLSTWSSEPCVHYEDGRSETND
tara:strand:+ start:11878 stop:12375 length:498 start_codon:yes stop_codon:yes gene_type:complete